MATSASLRIDLRYLRVGGTDFIQHALTPERYWEPDEAAFSLDSVPIHSHAIAYLAVDPALIRRTELLLADERSGRWRRVTETFWDEGRSRIIEVADSGQAQAEIIVDVAAAEDPAERDILRYGLVGARGALIFHSRIRTLADGGEREVLIYSITSDPGARHALEFGAIAEPPPPPEPSSST